MITELGLHGSPVVRTMYYEPLMRRVQGTLFVEDRLKPCCWGEAVSFLCSVPDLESDKQ